MLVSVAKFSTSSTAGVAQKTALLWAPVRLCVMGVTAPYEPIRAALGEVCRTKQSE